MYLTTSNIRKRIQEIQEQELEAVIEALDDGDSWSIRILPTDWLNEYHDEGMLLYMGSGKNRKVKKLKSKKAVFSLADRYGIPRRNIKFKLDYP